MRSILLDDVQAAIGRAVIEHENLCRWMGLTECAVDRSGDPRATVVHRDAEC